jgi:hypothetical protein
MSNRGRVAATVATALLLGAFSYANSFDLHLTGTLGSLWSHASWLVVYGLAIIAVFLVYRWWALLPALAPAAVGVYLYSLTDYEPPWRDEYAGGFSGAAYVLLVILGIVLQAAMLSIGLLLRAGWEKFSARRSSPAAPGLPARSSPRR